MRAGDVEHMLDREPHALQRFVTRPVGFDGQVKGLGQQGTARVRLQLAAERRDHLPSIQLTCAATTCQPSANLTQVWVWRPTRVSPALVKVMLATAKSVPKVVTWRLVTVRARLAAGRCRRKARISS